MQKIVWIGNPYFADSLGDCGWTARVLDFVEDRVFCWDDIVREAGFVPDVVVVGDNSRPPFVLGAEEFPCLTVFYSVDSHIHSWHPLYAQAFDACLVSLHDHLEKFAGAYLPQERIWWSPPFARELDRPRPDLSEKWDCLFVGSMNCELMPERYRFLTDLSRRVPDMHIMSGDYRSLFPYARVLVNQAERGDLNFRVFEAMGCGGCLVTPRVEHGLGKLFVDGEHMVGYVPGDAGDAAYKIQFLLDHPDVRDHIRQTGYEEVNSRHRPVHRAMAFTDHLCDLAINGAEEIIRQRIARSGEICKNSLGVPYLLWANEVSAPEIRAAYLAAAKGIYGLKGAIQ